MKKIWKIVSFFLVVTILLTSATSVYASSTDLNVSVPKRTVVTITVKNAGKFEGLEDPEFKYTVSGTLSKNITDIEIAREPGEAIGTYVIKAQAKNFNTQYQYVFKNGTFTIKEMPKLLKKIKQFKEFLEDVPLYISFYEQVVAPMKDLLKDVKIGDFLKNLFKQ